MSVTYDATIGRYRDTATGRLVSEAKVRAAIDAVADAASDRMADVTERLLAGELRLAEWQVEMMRTIKVSHVAAGVAAEGGRAQMTPAAYGFLGSEIRAQYTYLREFANGIEAGTVPLDGRLVARAGMYGQHARVTFEAATARNRAGIGYASERNILSASEHCAGCLAQSARGWVPIGTLVPIGSRQCMAMCRCRIAYSRQAAVAA